MEILSDVGEQWDSFSEIDKSAIATSLGGTYQRNTLMAILENWKEVGEAQEVAAESAGSTERKYSSYMDSIQAHLNQLSTAWSQFLINIDASGAAVKIIDAITGLVNLLDFLINKTPAATIVITALTAALIRLAAIKLTSLSNSIIELANNILNMKKAMSGMSSSASGGGFLNTLKNLFSGRMTGSSNKSGGIFSVIKNFLSGKSFKSSGAAKAATEVGEAIAGAGTKAVGAGAAITTLGGALKSLVPYGLIITGIGVAFDVLKDEIDDAIVTNDELAESMQTHSDNISNIESEIGSYNSQLDTNISRLAQINDLKGTSNWTPELEQEADLIERQNAQLREQIALKEREKELENESLKDEQREDYAREWNLDERSGWDKFTDFFTTPMNQSGLEGADLAAAKIKEHNKLVENYNSTLKDYREALNDENKTEEQRAQIKDQVQQAFDKAKESEEALLESRKKLDEYVKSGAISEDEANAIYDELNAMQMVGTAYENYGEYLDMAAAKSGDLVAITETLAETYEKLSGTQIIPEGFEDMSSWLQTISEEDLPKVQEVLLNTARSGNALKQSLAGMSASEITDVLISGWNEYYGIVEDCTGAVNEFNAALETDYTDQVTGYGQMLDYVMNSTKNGVKNAKAYRTALEGIGLSADLSLEEAGKQVQELYQSINKYMRFDSAGNLQTNLQAFWDDMGAAMQKAAQEGKNLGSINEETGEITISSYKEMADAMYIPEQAFMALMRQSEAFYEITETHHTTALQEMLTDIAEKANTAADALSGTVDSALKYGGIESVGNAEFGVQYNFAEGDFGEQARQNIINQINNAKKEFEQITQQTGIKFDLDIPVEMTSDVDVSKGIDAVQEAEESLQLLIDDAGNIDTSAFTNIASEIADSMPDDIEVDGNNITFKTDDAANAFVTQLQTSFEGLDIGSVISNAMVAGISFTGEGGTGANAFSGVAESIASGLVEQINSSLSAQEFAWSGALDTAIQDTGQRASDATTLVDGLKQKLEEASNIDMSGTKGQIDGVKTSATNANSSVSNLATALASLPSNKTVKLTFETNYTGSIPTPTSGGAPAANGRQMPAYANGKMGKPLRVQRNANSLVGEEGAELVISKSGQQKLVGENGAELVHLNAGDTVIPANVTSMIRQGQIGSFLSGKYGTSGALLATPSGWTTISNYSSKYEGGSSSGSGSSSGGGSSSKGSSSSGGGSSSSGGGSSSSSEDPAEDLIAELEHRRNMEYITEEQYMEELTKIWETYYKGKEEFRDKDWDLEEKIHDLRKQMIEDEIDTLEYQNGILERTYGTENQQIQNLVKMQNLYHQQAEEYRANGFDDLSPEIRELSEAWWDAYDEIKDLQNQMFENEIENLDHYIGLLDSKLERIPEVFDDFSLNMEDYTDLLNDNLDQYIGIQAQKVQLYEQQLASIQRELNRLYQEGYDKNRDIIMDLEQQAEDVKNNIYDIAEQVRDMKLDVIQKQLDRQGELQQAIIEYAEEQVELIEDENDALQEQIDALEKANEEKEKANELEKLNQDLEKSREALENAKKNRYKRVFHADTGY